MANDSSEQSAIKFSSPLQQQLYELLCCFHQLGRDSPQTLIQLAEIAEPQLPAERRIPVLGKMFEEVPVLLQQTAQLHALVMDPPHELQTLRLLIHLRELALLLHQLSYLQLLHLTNNIIPPGTESLQLEFLQKAQEIFQSWNQETLQRHHQVLSETPLHMERQQLLQSEPHIPWELLHFLIELLKLPIEELLGFQLWINKLPRSHLLLIVHLLHLEPSTLLELKQRFDAALLPTAHLVQANIKYPASLPSVQSTGTTTATSAPAAPNTKLLEASQHHHQQQPSPGGPPTFSITDASLSSSAGWQSSSGNSFMMDSTQTFSPSSSPYHSSSLSSSSNFSSVAPYSVMSGSSLHAPSHLLSSSTTISPAQVSPLTYSTDRYSQYQLRIARQPPSRTVYQRILKPFPAVMLVGASSTAVSSAAEGGAGNSNLFVEATLLRSDSDVELPLCIEGNRIVRISNGVFATFKKLKILSTSQQQGTLFRLKFTLKRYVGNVFEQIINATAITDPIEVFSHTLYLTEKQEAASAPPPIVQEVLPGSGVGGSRIVILGNGFVNSPQLKVRFGDQDITPTFHEQGTLICNVPYFQPPSNINNNHGGLHIPVRVSNDGVHFCDTKVFFLFQT